MNTRNKALVITGIILSIVALIVFLIGGWLSGWDFVAFFKSALFVWICVLVGLYLICVVALVIYDKIREL